ncbi:TonB family protein [Sphingomonas sp. DT-207]|uniref:TonB family protein n=1 Tax=Sphingomonas sp. DT-207 TaxID=3396167 RepID=UPI003F540D64
MRFERATQDALAVFDVRPPPPVPEPVPVPVPVPIAEAEGAAAPPNRRAVPKPVVAPTPAVAVRTPTAAPPVAAQGIAPSAGAAVAAGPGTGAGGQGAGLGAGGEGAGSGGGVAVRARRIRGGINIRDYPRAAEGMTGSVTVHLDVSAEGLVTGCLVARSSGNAALDATTCRLARTRFRYAPARDRAGRAVPDVAGWRQDWWVE